MRRSWRSGRVAARLPLRLRRVRVQHAGPSSSLPMSRIVPQRKGQPMAVNMGQAAISGTAFAFVIPPGACSVTV